MYRKYSPRKLKFFFNFANILILIYHFNYLRWYSTNDRIIRNIFYYYCIWCDNHIITYSDFAYHLAAYTNLGYLSIVMFVSNNYSRIYFTITAY